MKKAAVKHPNSKIISHPSKTKLELVCVADSFDALMVTVDHGADCVCVQYMTETMERASSHSHFDGSTLLRGIRYAKERGRKLVLRMDVVADPSNWTAVRAVIDRSVLCGIDAIMLRDPALLLYVATNHPGLELRYIVEPKSLHADAIKLMHARCGIARVLLPPVVSVAQLRNIAMSTLVGIELSNSARLVGKKPESAEACAITAINQNSLPQEATENLLTGLCANGDEAANDTSYSYENLSASSILAHLPELTALGVSAIRMESHPAELAQVATLTRVWREAIDQCGEDGENYAVKPSWIAELGSLPH